MARAFALAYVAMHDAGVACWKAKYSNGRSVPSKWAPNSALSFRPAQSEVERLPNRLDTVADLAAVPVEPDAAWRITTAAALMRPDFGGIHSVVQDTGHIRKHEWLRIPVLNASGEIIHRGGVTPPPGHFALALRLIRRRPSFIDGVAHWRGGCGVILMVWTPPDGIDVPRWRC